MNGVVTKPRRWDPIVRITHWAIAAAIVVNRLITEGGSQAHIWIGLALAGLLILRWVWGLIGPAEARFSSFPPSLRGALSHIGDIRHGRHTRHRSHNPLGALMVYALWATMAIVIASGVAMTGFPPKVHHEAAPTGATHTVATREAEGPEAEAQDAEVREEGSHQATGEGGERGEGEGPAEEIHEIAANLLLVLAALHLAGVVFEVRRSGRQVVTAMIDGGERAKES
ncbi:cytochrome b/b6 domain-containing protein [Caulobacter sp. 602-1]|uniref:cytochrome b/b6 domain-containing protein n=1 Tax=Caulobacter sp. 602-1 TaxID=2492472 RepID=UPI000F63AEF5|nr:cytochrome b/b6 domain-containing protein [Caulobacter sp. 602-1]RRN63818.1 cytochrome B [Caulobacter sp. 602-1]